MRSTCASSAAGVRWICGCVASVRRVVYYGVGTSAWEKNVSLSWPVLSWPVYHDQFIVTSTSWPVYHDQFIMTSSSWPVYHDQFIMTSLSWPVHRDQFIMTSSSWPVYHDQYLTVCLCRAARPNALLIVSSDYLFHSHSTVLHGATSICHSVAFQTWVGGNVQSALGTGGLTNSAGTMIHLVLTSGDVDTSHVDTRGWHYGVEQVDWPTPQGQWYTSCWPLEMSRHAWTLGGDTTVLDDYALAMTTVLEQLS